MTAPEIAALAHAGQFRRDGVTPYIKHPEKVASFFEKGSVEWNVAWLHDVVEDTSMTLEELDSYNLPSGVVTNVYWLTHRKSESYQEYIERLARGGIARKVKIADIFANLSDNPTERQKIKYADALKILLAGL